MYNHIARGLYSPPQLLFFFSFFVGYLGDQDYVEFYGAHVDT